MDANLIQSRNQDLDIIIDCGHSPGRQVLGGTAILIKEQSHLKGVSQSHEYMIGRKSNIEGEDKFTKSMKNDKAAI